ncbi:MAG: class I SAM-dependent methyltransferase [Planctomycetes bacterium]|nr:class I SAM-dependent methyltransferase [Planctomycetota bacterium]
MELELRSPVATGDLRIEVGLSSGPIARRLHTARRTDPLPRAIGLPRRQAPPRVVDATAGLGRDALLLAHLGCEVTAIERIPAFVMLLRAAVQGTPLERALRTVRSDAIDWLRTEGSTLGPDVVYLDPMFADEGRAQVKKDMQACRALAGPAADVEELFAAAREVAHERVVVKRHPDSAPLATSPSFVVEGERIRFDVYLRSPSLGTPPR